SDAARPIERHGERQSEPAPTPLGLAVVRRGPRPPWDDVTSAPPAAPEAASPTPASPNGLWRLERTIRVGVGYLYRALPTPDGASLVVLSARDGGLRCYDRASGKLRRRIDLPDYVEFEDADFALVGEPTPRALVVRASGVVSYDLVGESEPRALALPAGDGVAAARPGLWGFVRREVETQTGALSLRWLDADGSSTPALEVSTSERPDAWSLSNDGRRLAINYYPSNQTQLLDLEHGTLSASIPAPEYGANVAFAPSGQYLALGGARLALHALDGRLLATDEAFDNNISDVRFTPDGALLLVSAYDSRVRSYALPAAGAALPERLPKPQVLRHANHTNVYALGVSRDGRLLVTPSGDQTIKVWVR
ncbi:MAG TPA: WD40 repeat domain-containing protein, partial [Polyangiaceae bacterium]|nr:WD40 repeat domain-containing protein [Polyangiaceae bacterium]